MTAEEAGPIWFLPSASPSGLCYGLYHCARPTVILRTVISCKVLRLQGLYGESEICSISTATEPRGDPRLQTVCSIDQQLRGLPWFLLVPGYIVANTLTGLASDGDLVSKGG